MQSSSGRSFGGGGGLLSIKRATKLGKKNREKKSFEDHEQLEMRSPRVGHTGLYPEKVDPGQNCGRITTHS